MLVRDVCEIACGPEHLLAPLHPHDSASCIRVTRLASSTKFVMTAATCRARSSPKNVRLLHPLQLQLRMPEHRRCERQVKRPNDPVLYPPEDLRGQRQIGQRPCGRLDGGVRAADRRRVSRAALAAAVRYNSPTRGHHMKRILLAKITLIGDQRSARHPTG
jgi:hypothetical protein